MAEYYSTIILTAGFCNTAWQTTWRTDPLVRTLAVQRTPYQMEHGGIQYVCSEYTRVE